VSGHAGFALLNRTGNPLVRALLRSPLHVLLSRNLALVTYTGRRSGREHTIPVGYTLDGDRVRVVVGVPERKRWWRNLRGGAPVRVRLRGGERSGHAEAHGDEASGVTVEIQLEP
jgi:F420H(2)-dependent quinone reductase